jgi:hypothetical protein
MRIHARPKQVACILLALCLLVWALLVSSPDPTAARDKPPPRVPKTIQIELPNMWCGVLFGPKLNVLGGGINTISCVPKEPCNP